MLLENILILADYPDLIKHQKIHAPLVRQLYTTLFLLDHFTAGQPAVIQLNDRSKMDYRQLWNPQSPPSTFINRFLSHLPWDDIDFSAYSLIICHFDYEQILQRYLNNRYQGQYPQDKIYSLVNPAYKPAAPIYKSIITLFHPKGKWEVPDTLKNSTLHSFKQSLTTAWKGHTRKEQEQSFHALLLKIIAANKRYTPPGYRKILVLDDYKRSFFIGDSTVWVRFMKRVLRNCGAYEEVKINCYNYGIAPRLRELYGNTFGENVTISCLPWEQLNFSDYDLILVEGDLMLPFLLHISPLYDAALLQTAIYTLTPLKEDDFEDSYGWDFLTQHPATAPRSLNEDKEIYITDAALTTADQWLEKHGITSEDYLVILQNGSTEDKKVLLFSEFIAVLQGLLLNPRVKVLIFDGAEHKQENNIQPLLTVAQKERVLFAAGLGLTMDMCLIASPYTRLAIGPCTGIFHLANGAVTYLVNNGLRDRSQIPYMLVYTGKQAHDEGYLPRNWWNNSFVNCAVIIRQDDQLLLVPLEESPADTDTFQNIAGEVHAITAAMLMAYLPSLPTL
ncbi:glycosyltransferase family 9 protein [Chitinophaga rhizophila]|uniref:ADP-heptose:LPS heptosyltransferase n=1 Tax=Chitinophaga rhizophila TaxID=2866212 RepID=A0ABS7GGV7_9BACT|nr:hypothetical protein [Chitinophaga rhizophila]MBW8686009.1 hypothetical protein [Chitinophaga rhizophila]